MVNKSDIVASNLKMIKMPDGSVKWQERRRTRIKYKTSAAARRAAAIARKKLKLPLVRGTIIVRPGIKALKEAKQVYDSGAGTLEAIEVFGEEIIYQYLGIDVTGAGNHSGVNFLTGVGAIGGLALDSKYLGTFRYANSFLANNNIPIVRF